jgi:type II secretion system protein I
MRATGKKQPRGFTLLEVILALAILAMSMGAIGGLMGMASRNGKSAVRLTEAQLLCESKMAEITAGLAPLVPVQDAPHETDDGWLYSVQIEPLEDGVLLAVRVTVAEDLPPERQPTEFSLFAWMHDPGLELPEEVEGGDDGTE